MLSCFSLLLLSLCSYFCFIYQSTCYPPTLPSFPNLFYFKERFVFSFLFVRCLDFLCYPLPSIWLTLLVCGILVSAFHLFHCKFFLSCLCMLSYLILSVMSIYQSEIFTSFIPQFFTGSFLSLNSSMLPYFSLPGHASLFCSPHLRFLFW